MNKKEIEQAKDDFQFFNEGEYITREMSVSKEVLFKYIEQLENKVKEQEESRQALINKLEKQNKHDEESVKRYEKMRRGCQENYFYKRSYQTSIHKLNAKREVRKHILSIIKDE